MALKHYKYMYNNFTKMLRSWIKQSDCNLFLWSINKKLLYLPNIKGPKTTAEQFNGNWNALCFVINMQNMNARPDILSTNNTTVWLIVTLHVIWFYSYIENYSFSKFQLNWIKQTIHTTSLGNIKDLTML